MHDDDYTRFKTFQVVKRIVCVLAVLYLFVVLNSPEALEALPDLQRCLEFYQGMIEYLTQQN